MIRFFKTISLILVLLVVSMCTLLFFMPAPPLMSGTPHSQAVYDDQNQLLRMTLSQDAKYRLWTPLTAISPQLITATLLQEDQYYRWHLGINPVSLLKAGWKTYIGGPRRMGASTITMQVARMAYGLNTKTLSGKIRQIIYALQLECHYNKNQILEAYLNLAPYGNNIEGVGAASLIYFNKPANQLTLPEALTLVVIPQNPTKRIHDLSALKAARDKLYGRWLTEHAEDSHQKALMALPLQIRNLHSIPFLAPHFVNEVLANTNKNDIDIHTTLNLRMQRVVERVARHYVARKKNLGVNNVAVLLIDTRDMGIKALLGSENFFNTAIGGQINGTETKRSPGSTLKPFIYALAMDQGLIHPATVLKDVPHSFGSYNPENFDYDFMGPVKARDALTLSRNIPAIYLAEQLKQPSLYEFLQQAGVRDLKSESYYGLALVLGGAEMSMRELVGLYAVLANEGVWQPLRSRQEVAEKTRKRVLSPEASYLVLEMLQNTQGTNGDQAALQKQQVSVAWKTGTSSGYRDAWTLGIMGHYVLGVWIGNFNNQGNPVFVGKEMAAPLFFEIANAVNIQIPSKLEVQKNPGSLNLTKVEVCKASGMLPTRYCTDTESVWFIPGKSPIKTDTIHREIAINSKTGSRACQFDKNTRFEVYEFWPSDLLRIFKRAGIQRRIPPAYDVACDLNAKSDAGFAPQIQSPQTQVNYVARLDSLKDTTIPLTAVVDAGVRNLYWFLNDAFIGKTTRDKALLWQAKPGHYVVRVVDDFGRADARDVVVRVEN